MNKEKRYSTVDEEDVSMIAAEPAALEYSFMEKEVEDVANFNFGYKDFGYPHTIDELNAALDQADAERNDPTKWVTNIEFHTRIESKHPWLR